MSAKSDLDGVVRTLLEPGEEVLVRTIVQVKGGVKRRLSEAALKAVVLDAATLVATGGAFGVLAVAVPPSAWLVVTSRRLLLVSSTNLGRRLGEVLVHVPRAAVSVTLKRGLVNTVTLADVADGQSLLQLNLGVRGSAARSIVAAVSG